MADTSLTINGKVVLDSSGAEVPLVNMKKALKEANAELVSIIEHFGEMSPEAIKAAQKVANLKDSIGDAKAMSDSFSPDKKMEAFGSAIRGVVGGFSALQGAQALFGAESKDLEKTLVKVQGAMALSQGISEIGAMGDSLKNLKNVATTAFNGIKAAIGSTGIGLLVVALGAIYAYWDDIKGAVSGVSAEQKKLNASAQAHLDVEKEKLKAVGSQDNVLKLQGKSERDILNIKIAQIDQTILATKAVMEQNTITTKGQIDAAQRNKDILQGIIRFIELPLEILWKTASSVVNTLIEGLNKVPGVNIDFRMNGNLINEGEDWLAKQVFDPESVKTEADKVKKENENALKDLENQRAGAVLAIQGIDKKASDDAIANKKKSDEEAKKIAEENAKKEEERRQNEIEQNAHTDQLITEARLAGIKDANDKKQFQLAVNQQAEIDAELERLNQKLITEEQYQINRTALETKHEAERSALLDQIRIDNAKKDEDERVKKETDALKKTDDLANMANDNALQLEQRKAYLDQEKALLDQQFANKVISEEKYNEKVKKNSEARKNVDKLEKEAKEKNAQAISGLLGSLSELVGKQTVAGKAFAVAQATIDTYLSAQKAYASMSGIPVVGPALGAVAAGVAVAGGIMNVKKILSTQVPGGGGAGGSTPDASVPPLPPTADTTALPIEQINSLASANATTRAYVVESDVSGNQERIERLNRAARIN